MTVTQKGKVFVSLGYVRVVPFVLSKWSGITDSSDISYFNNYIIFHRNVGS